MELDKHGGVMGAKVGQAASEAWAHTVILSEMEAMGGSSAGRDAWPCLRDH